MRNAFIIFGLALCLFSCSEKEKLKEALLIMQERPFSLPLDDMVYVGDTLESPHEQSSYYKLIVYTDSSQCASCKIRSMRNWNPFEERLKSSRSNVKLFFIFHPAFRDRQTLSFVMRVMPPSGFVYVDTANCFARLNPQMPDNPSMHTFLLDEENKVLLVGSPLDNPDVEEIFWRIVTEKRAEK